MMGCVGLHPNLYTDYQPGHFFFCNNCDTDYELIELEPKLPDGSTAPPIRFWKATTKGL